MRSLLAALLIVALPGAGQARTDTSPDHALAGRTAGKPVSCIHLHDVDDSQTFDSGDILYRMKGGDYYLNAPRPVCPGLRAGTGTVTHTPSDELCRGDIAEIVDFASHMQYGGCSLGDFVPYPRPPKAAKQPKANQ